MSSISSIGSGAQNIYQFLQSLTGASQSQPSTATGSSSSSSSSTNPSQALGQVLQGGHHHHHHGGGGALKKIQDAVTTALQTAQQTGSTSDPNKIVEDAIAQVLKNGISGTSTSGTPGAPETTGTAAGGDTAGTGAAASGQSNAQSFFNTLQSLGISPKQFQQDFLAAIKDAQGGQVNPATAFQNVPLGTTVDTIG